MAGENIHCCPFEIRCILKVEPGPHVLLVTGTWIVQHGVVIKGWCKVGFHAEANGSYQIFDKGTYNYSIMCERCVFILFTFLHVFESSFIYLLTDFDRNQS